MNYDNINHNRYPDGCTLTNCTYTNIKEGTTGTFTNCNFVEIELNNTGLTLDNVNYCTIGDNNRNVTIADASYVLVGDANINLTIGRHTIERFTDTGADSVIAGYATRGNQITGEHQLSDRSSSTAMGGFFNRVEDGAMCIVDRATGSDIRKAKRIDISQTNNARVETTNLTLAKRSAFLDYALVGQTTRVVNRNRTFERQSDADGVLLDYQSESLVNDTKGKGQPKYAKIDGIWTLVE